MNEKQFKYNIQILLDESNQLTVQYANVPFPELVRLCLIAIEKGAEKILETAPEELKEAVSSDMYDLINMGASTLLHRVFPDIDMRPDLTVEAILEAEDKIMEEQPELVKEAHEAYLDSSDFAKDTVISEKVKAQLKKDKKVALGIKDHKSKAGKLG